MIIVFGLAVVALGFYLTGKALIRAAESIER